MDNIEEKQDKHKSKGNSPASSDQQQVPSVAEQVRREFEYSADRGQTEEEQLENELAEPDYVIPSPTKSLNDAKFKNITADQKGRALGIANQRNEPLNITKEIEERDEDRWSLNPASAETDTKESGGK